MGTVSWGDFVVDLDDRVGGGSMGTLYRARQASLGRTVAVKVLSAELSADATFSEQFENEAKLAARLQHENIVQVFGAGEADGRRYIAFELIEGLDLKAFLGRRRREGRGLSDGEVLGLGLQVAAALGAAHAAGIVHRDIKPSNIMVSTLSRAALAGAAVGPRLAGVQLKVSDFGIAHVAHFGEERTAWLETMGSPAYMAPEQIDGKEGGPESDVYSLGVILYELLTGQAPFAGSLAEICAGHVLAEVVVPKEGHSAALVNVIRRCLEKSPIARYADGEDLFLDLSAIGRRLERQLAEQEESESRESSAGITRNEETASEAATQAIAPPRPGDDTGPVPAPSEPEKRDPSDTVLDAPSTRVDGLEESVKTAIRRAPPLPLEAARGGSPLLSETSAERRRVTREHPTLGSDEARVRCGADLELFPGRKLGEGGMGTVYLGRQLSLDRSVAIKVLKLDSQDAADSTIHERFRRESRMAGRLQHPNVVQVLAAGEIEEEGEFRGLPFYAMEVVAGDDLRTIQGRGEVCGLRDTLQIVEQVASGLVAAAELDLVHRDIKPGNIIVARVAGELQVKLADFGLVKDLNAGSLTERGTVLGSVAYMAPEQLSGQVDGRADIYALGITWYQLLTGRLPFEARSVSAMLLAHRKTPAPRVRGVPEGVADAIAKCLEKNPADRWGSARELLLELRRLREEVHGLPEEAEPQKPLRYEDDALLTATQRFERPSGLWQMLLAALLVFGLGLGGLLTAAFSYRKGRLRTGHGLVASFLIAGEHGSAGEELEHLRSHFPKDQLLRLLGDWRRVVAGVAALRLQSAAQDLSRSTAQDLRLRCQQLGSLLRPIRGALGAALAEPVRASLESLDTELKSLSAELERRARAPQIPKGMAVVPGGEFYMGTQRVRLSRFALDLHEVTRAEYDRFLGAVRAEGHRWCHPSQRGQSKDHRPETWGLGGEPSLPASGVDWFDAFAYAEWAGKRLPTEAEWERAVRSAKDLYPWGNEFDPNGLRWAGGPEGIDAERMALAPGSVPRDRGPYGHMDLLGNVREWCADWFQDFAPGLSDGLYNPTGPRRGTTRVLRGFSWAVGNPDTILAFARSRARPSTRLPDLGFRCAVSLSESD